MMKKTFKWGWILLVVGIVFLIVGGFAHGAKDVVFNNWRPMVYSTKADYHKNYDIDDFDQIDVSASNADVKIRRGNEYQVKYSGRKSARPSVKVVNGRLTVRQKGSTQKNRFVGFRWFGNEKDVSNKLTVYVPDNVKLKKVRNLNNYGETDIKGISTDYLEAIGSEGALKLSNMNIDDANVEMRDSSEVRFENTNLLAGLVTSEDSDINISNGALRRVEIQQEDGDVNMRNVALDGGKAELSDGDINLSESTVSRGYLVTNDDGDNVLRNIKAGGYEVVNEDGDNSLFGKTSEGGNIHSGTRQNVITVKNSSGDNTVR